ncbi:MAG TPA: helix-turn-helix domain-containing protein [Cyclobacteriaceae bacterium]|nr:helix-turn-helix domain-containing protein [Cyclobacteriaceae bacterium]HMX00916.1 helix-turn-helix domain-containing protein [Cyclobacteriaceae bacterium]HMX50041.1 helix-turn-helix domain-containing protein [Cyclobacteriaceae bacterium]HMY93720.1 helix-turn-helix domain-containing protein [Cyclobacteriaceae bacterium]HNA12625.1 helix-turn-helix domain-containing protein [Cyclobacteriaceae bacterium]
MKDRNEGRINRDQLITVGDLEIFKTSLIQEIKNLLTNATGTTAKKWLKSSEVRKLLGISSGTLQNLRVNGSLNFTKLGGIIFYDCDEIQKLLRDNAER